MNESWLVARSQRLEEKLASLGDKRELSVAFIPSPETDHLRYLPENLHSELATWIPDGFRLIDPGATGEVPDIVIATTHVSDREPSWLWELRETYGEHSILALWMWDNHLDHEVNLKAALVADMVFPSHAYDATYLISPNALLSFPVSACSAQWTREMALSLGRELLEQDRRHAVLMNYAKYDFAPERNRLIDLVGLHVPEAEMLLMDPSDRSRYFSKSRRDRFAEWADYKVTLVVPMIADLSTRFFDAMLAGLVPIVPKSVVDLDRLLPRDEQERLGIVRLNSYALPDVQAAVAEAFEIFDQQGMAGVWGRHRYVLENHMLINRLTEMLYPMYLHGQRQLKIAFRKDPWGPGMYYYSLEQ